MKTLTDKQAQKLVTQAFEALHFLNNKSWTNHREELFRICKEEEKSHRGFLPEFSSSHTEDTWSLPMAAKYFAVHRIAEYLNGAKQPSGSDYLHIQKSCFYASALVAEFGEEIRQAWIGLQWQPLTGGPDGLEYTDFVKVAA